MISRARVAFSTLAEAENSWMYVIWRPNSVLVLSSMKSWYRPAALISSCASLMPSRLLYVQMAGFFPVDTRSKTDDCSFCRTKYLPLGTNDMMRNTMELSERSMMRSMYSISSAFLTAARKLSHWSWASL